MSLVAQTPTVIVDNFNIFEAIGSITITGSYVNNGVTFDLTPTGVASSLAPIAVEIIETAAAGVIASGYNFVYVPGTTVATSVILAFASGGTQAAASTFASLNITALTYRAIYKKL